MYTIAMTEALARFTAFSVVSIFPSSLHAAALALHSVQPSPRAPAAYPHPSNF